MVAISVPATPRASSPSGLSPRYLVPPPASPASFFKSPTPSGVVQFSYLFFSLFQLGFLKVFHPIISLSLSPGDLDGNDVIGLNDHVGMDVMDSAFFFLLFYIFIGGVS